MTREIFFPATPTAPKACMLAACATTQVWNYDNTFEIPFVGSFNLNSGLGIGYDNGAMCVSICGTASYLNGENNYSATGSADVVAGYNEQEGFIGAAGGGVSISKNGKVIYEKIGSVGNQAGYKRLGVNSAQEYSIQKQKQLHQNRAMSINKLKTERTRRQLELARQEELAGMYASQLPQLVKPPEVDTMTQIINYILGIDVVNAPAPGTMIVPNQPHLWSPGGPAMTAGEFTDASDYHIITTGKNLDSTEASDIDKAFAYGGAFLPVVSGGFIKKVGSGLIDGGKGIIDNIISGTSKQVDNVVETGVKKVDDIIIPTKGKKFNQISRRGWTESSIQETVNNPFTTRPSLNKANGNSATAYFNKDGSYVVIDDITHELIQISDKTRPWVPDPEIINPYLPQ